MKFFLDTARVEEIEEAKRLGVLAGVTTNPTLLARAHRSQQEVITQLLEVCPGTVHIEVVGDRETMLRQGRELAAISPQLVVKVPMCADGLAVAHQLDELDISVNVTLVFSVNQALLAAQAGATFVSPFAGRMEDINQDGIALIEDIVQAFTVQALPTMVLAASLRTPAHVTSAALAGAHIATVSPQLLNQMMQHPLTQQGIERFEQDWKTVSQLGASAGG